MENPPQILTAEIVSEHELLDGAGIVWDLRLQLADGRPSKGHLAVTESAAPRKRRRLTWRGSGNQVLEALFSAPPETKPKRGPYMMRRARRLAAVADLLAKGAQLTEYGALSSLTWEDSRERARRDRLGRRWTIHEIAQSDYGAVLVRASVAWPEQRLERENEMDLRRHHVIELGGKVKDLRFGFACELTLPNEKARKQLLTSLSNGSWATMAEPSLAELLVDANGGFADVSEARAIFSHLRRKKFVARYQKVRSDTLMMDAHPAPPDVDRVEVIETREVCTEGFTSLIQNGALYLVRVHLALPPGRKRRPAPLWMALHAGKHHDLPVLHDLCYDRATCLMLSEVWQDLVPRLLVAPDDGWRQSPEWTEAEARAAWMRAIEEDSRRRRKRERMGRLFRLCADAELADGRHVLRLTSEWPRLDPVLGPPPRPSEHVIVVEADGIGMLDLDTRGGYRSFNAKSEKPTNIPAALKTLRAGGPGAEEARWNVEYLLRASEGGFIGIFEADAAWMELVGEPVARHEISETEGWSRLWEKHPEVTEAEPAASNARHETGNKNTSADPVEMPAMLPVARDETSNENVPDITPAQAEPSVVAEVARDETPATEKTRRGRPPGEKPPKTSTERSRALRERKRLAAGQPPRKGGRPPKGEMAMSSAERSKAYRQRRKADGLALLRISIPEEKVEAVRAAIERLLADEG